MIPFKNIMLSIFFVTHIIEIVLSDRKNEVAFLCAQKLYAIFGWDEGKKYYERKAIPKLALSKKTYTMLAEEGQDVSMAQKYYMHIYELLRANDNMLTLKKWCANNLYEVDDCYGKLRLVYLDSANPTEILKDAYLRVVADRLDGFEYFEANRYFKHILKNLNCIDGEEFMTPTEICYGKKKADPKHAKYNKKRKEPGSGHEGPSKTSKTKSRLSKRLT